MPFGSLCQSGVFQERVIHSTEFLFSADAYYESLLQVASESANSQTGERPLYDFLESCLRHKSEMVILEAARAIAELNGVTSREVTPAITVLQLFLNSPKPVLRFAAIRTLNKVLYI